VLCPSGVGRRAGDWGERLRLRASRYALYGGLLREGDRFGGLSADAWSEQSLRTRILCLRAVGRDAGARLLRRAIPFGGVARRRPGGRRWFAVTTWKDVTLGSRMETRNGSGFERNGTCHGFRKGKPRRATSTSRRQRRDAQRTLVWSKASRTGWESHLSNVEGAKARGDAGTATREGKALEGEAPRECPTTDHRQVARRGSNPVNLGTVVGCNKPTKPAEE
jgi:hypothetical protein